MTDYDQLGRVRLTRQLESASQSVDDDTAGIKVQTRYEYSNPLSYQIVSNPYRADKSSDAGGEATMGWTVTASDWSHRLTSATASGGASAPTAPAVTGCPTSGSQITCYSGNVTTTSDEASVMRTNTVDGLGRLTQVVENGIAATTTNVYDVLGNLTGVTHAGYATGCGTPQGGTVNRSFFYDSLGRLGKACNPESGSTTYTYDNNSNLTQKTDARGITATFAYDAANRLTSKTYSDNPACSNPSNSTPCVNYNYPSGQDFLASVSSGASTYSYSNYDAMARPGAGSQTTAGANWTFPSVVWTPQGQVHSFQYPSGRVVTTSYDPAGRISGVTGALNGTLTNYVSGTSYAAQGGLMQWSGGDTVTRTMTYNARLQMTQIAAGSLMTVGLNWGPVNNNGTLQQQTINRQNGVLNTTQTYGYDGVNRLTSAAEPGNWNQSYVYDNVGNRAVTGNSTVLISNYTPQTSLSSPPPPGSSANWPFDPATNHWAAPAAAYDAAGNTTGVRTQAMGYDAELRMTSWSDSSTGAAVSFTYDGDGRRVTKTSSVGTTTYVYDPLGNLAEESGALPAGAAATSYLTRDHLGSVRLVTNGSGGGCLGAHDYLPFGEEIPGTLGRGAVPCYPAMDTQSDTAWKFGGQERDAETGFDNFLARHMAGPMGRFLSVDPGNAGGSAGDPQSWNMYSYVLTNPLKFIDPTGMACVYSGSGDTSDPNNCYDDKNGGQSCNDAFASPPQTVTVNSTPPQTPYDFSGYQDQDFLNTIFSTDVYSTALGNQTQQASLFPSFSFLQNVDWRKLGSTALSCTADHYGLTGVAAGIGALGIPIPKALVLGRTAALSGASSTMSLASAIEYGLFKGAGPRLATPLLGTTRVLGVIGRAAPVVSAALFAYDAASIGYCVYQGSK